MVENEKEAICSLAENIFKNREMEGIMLFVFPESQHGIGYPNEEDSKEMFLSYLKKYCLENKITHFYLLSEAWTTTDPSSMPSESPDRMEKFIISHVSKGQTTILVAEIHNAGKTRFLGEWSEEFQEVHTFWEQCL